MTDEYGGVDETTDVRIRRQAERALAQTRESAAETDALLERRDVATRSLRRIYDENHFGKKYRDLFRAQLGVTDA